MKSLMVLSLLMGCCLPSTQPYEAVVSRYGVVLTDSGWGSLVNIGGGYCLTAYHVLRGSNAVLFGENDIALFKSESNIDTLEINDIVELGQTVYWIQPVSVDKVINPYVNRGTVNRITDEQFYIDHPVFPGASGSGVFNEGGELVGVITELTTWNFQVTYGVAAKVNQFRKHIERARREP